MSYTITFEHPHFPHGHAFGINNLGVVLNGNTVEISEDTERQFVASQGKTVEDAFPAGGIATISGSSALSPDEVKSLLPQPAEVTPDVVDNTSNSADSSVDTTSDTPSEVVAGDM